MSVEVKKIWWKRKQEKYVSLLRDVLEEAEKEKAKPDSIWGKDLIDDVVVPEMKELLEYAEKEEAYFKYGKRQARLVSTYFMFDSLEPRWNTILGSKILELQILYRKL